MDWDRLITIEQMEEATNTLLETGKKVGADSWQQRVKNQTPHCGFGEASARHLRLRRSRYRRP